MTLAVVSSLLIAASPGFELEWRAPESCAPKPDVSALVGTATGRAEVRVRELADGWEVLVLFFEPYEGLRRVKARSCAEAARAATLLVQLGARGALGSALPAPEPTPTPPPPPPAVEVEPVPVPVPVSEAPSSPALHVSIHAGAALDVGSFSVPDPRLAVSAQLSVGALRVAVDGRFGFAVKLPDAAAEASRAIEVQLAVCGHFEWRALSWGPCAGAALGSWRLVTASSRVGETLVAAAGPQVRATLGLVAGLELGAVAGLRFNLRRPRPFDERGTLFETPLLAGDFQLTAGWRW